MYRSLEAQMDCLPRSIENQHTQIDTYIPFHSHHHQRTTTGALRRQLELNRLQEVFQANGFPEDLVKKTLRSNSTPAPLPEAR